MFAKTIIVLVMALALPAISGEIVKWVDENGKVHYGDKVPDKYKTVAEPVKANISVVSPEDDVRVQNKLHATQLKNEDAEAEKERTQHERERQKAEAKINKKSWQPQTQEECRNRYMDRVKQRTECFKRVEELAK